MLSSIPYYRQIDACLDACSPNACLLDSLQQKTAPYLQKVRNVGQRIRLQADQFLEEKFGDEKKKWAYELLQLAPFGLAFSAAPLYVQIAFSVSSIAHLMLFEDPEKASRYYQQATYISGLASGFNALKYAGAFYQEPSWVPLLFLGGSLVYMDML